MKPLTEWTDLDLLLLTRAAETLAGTPGAVAELLGRERERCAKECDRMAQDMAGSSLAAVAAVISLAERIRGLS